MTVGYYAPLPPARTGVADYAAALLAELRRHGTVEVERARCDVALYHTGNNGLHAEIYRRALKAPGVVVLHDAVLHHFLLGHLTESEYLDEFVYNYGEWNRELARDLWRGRAASGTDSRYFEYPMLKRLAEGARAVVVHNPAAAEAVRRHAPGARVVEIPHLWQEAPPVTEGEAMRYRQEIGIDPAAYLFGVFGYLRESKRLVSVLEAFRRVHRENTRTALLVAGAFVSSDLERAVAPFVGEAGVVRRPHLPDREFWVAARAVDACINLRYPSAGETSGIGIRLMGMGKPVLVTEGLECKGLPEDGCVRIAAGVAERESLLEHLLLLTSISGVGSAIGQRGSEYVRSHHRVDLVGRQYWQLLSELCA